MKLQYGTVELRIKDLNEELQYYNQAYINNDSISLSQSRKRINEITVALRKAIKNGHWYSDELVILNGKSRQNPVSFYIVFNKHY